MTGPRPGRSGPTARRWSTSCRAASASARWRLPLRRQSGDVHLHRQLQDRPGACAGAARAAGQMSTSIDFAPQIPLLLLWSAIGIGALADASRLSLRARGAWARALAFAALIFVLANPLIVHETREPLADVVALVIDRSQSMGIGEPTRAGRRGAGRDPQAARRREGSGGARKRGHDDDDRRGQWHAAFRRR